MHPIAVGPRDLILLAGLPGAGKSTLLAGLRDVPPLTVRDSDQVRELFSIWLPSWLPYRAYRPLVHVGHHLRVLVAALCAPGPVLVHDPATRSGTRTALVVLAWLSRRPGVFVWLDVPPSVALEGQRARGRLVSPRSFARHVARADLLRRGLLAGIAPSGWRCVVLLDREAMRSGLRLAVQGPAECDFRGAGKGLISHRERRRRRLWFHVTATPPATARSHATASSPAMGVAIPRRLSGRGSA